MSILVNKQTRVIVQGGTGKQGSLHLAACQAYGTQIVGVVRFGKGGERHQDVPIFNTVQEARNETKADCSLIFVPPAFCADAILEAIEAEVPFVVVITEGIPVMDMIRIKHRLSYSNTKLLGPNCPGIITPEETKIGIMPGNIHKAGNIGVVSRSGTLTYEAVAQLTKEGLGQSTCIGIGGDPVQGLSFIDVLSLFEQDEQTQAVVLIGEIGGSAEEEAASYIASHFSKPVVSYIAGQEAPSGKRMGHAGAIISSTSGKAADKMKALAQAGVHVVNVPCDIGRVMKQILQG